MDDTTSSTNPRFWFWKEKKLKPPLDTPSIQVRASPNNIFFFFFWKLDSWSISIWDANKILFYTVKTFIYVTISFYNSPNI